MNPKQGGRQDPARMAVRRVVTGHDELGRSIVLFDDNVDAAQLQSGSASFAVVWTTVSSPVDNDDAADRSKLPMGLTQQGGSVLRFVELGPESRSPMHRTNSLDYGIVLEGEPELELDGGALTALRAGDVVVQRGTIHAWRNRSSKPARMAFILLDALPATSGGQTLLPFLHETDLE